MSLLLRLDADLKDAMRARDQTRMDTIRHVKTATTMAEVKQGSALNDAQVEEIIARLVKQRRESIELFLKGKRQDLVDKEEAEIKVLQAYLPQQMSTDEIKAAVRKVVEEVGAKGPGDKGKVMGKLMPLVKGKADGQMVNTIVTEALTSL
jgi:uncharacterized protein YqeY